MPLVKSHCSFPGAEELPSQVCIVNYLINLGREKDVPESLTRMALPQVSRAEMKSALSQV